MTRLTKNLEESKKIAEYLEASNVGIKVLKVEAGEYGALVFVGVPAHSSIQGKTYETEKVWSMTAACSLVSSMR